MGIEEWTTEDYSFPISISIFKTITKVLGLDLRERALIKDAEDLISVLSEDSVSPSSPSVRVITIQKQRELHVWPCIDNDGVTIELAEIKTPEKVTSKFLSYTRSP